MPQTRFVLKKSLELGIKPIVVIIGMSTKSIDSELYNLILTTAVLTMILTPVVSAQTSRLYALKKRWFQKEQLESMNFPDTGFEGHVVIAGGGRVGTQIATTLDRLDIPFVIIELDQRRVEQAQQAGFAVVYGDASHEIVLEAAAVAHASMLVVTLPGIVESRTIVAAVRKVNSTVAVVARLSDPDFFELFSELQVTDLVYPELEAGLEMTRQVLLGLRIPATEVQRQTESLRQEYFSAGMSQSKPYRTLSQFRSAEHQFDLQWVSINDASPLVDQTIGQAEIRKSTGVSVVGVLRDDQLEPNPGPDFRFRAKDLVAVIGSGQARDAFRERFFADGPALDLAA